MVSGHSRYVVFVLAVIVLVRTVLSLSIDVEIDGRWPWKAAEHEALARAANARRGLGGDWGCTC